MNPSTEDILHAIDATPAEIVFVLPDNKNIIMAAQAAAELACARSRGYPDQDRPAGHQRHARVRRSNGAGATTEAAMTDCHLPAYMTMQITYAARDSRLRRLRYPRGATISDCATVRWLFGTDARRSPRFSRRLADKAAEARQSAEFINIFYGADIQESDAEAALELFRQHAPDAEVNLVSGGQPIYYYLISAE